MEWGAVVDKSVVKTGKSPKLSERFGGFRKWKIKDDLYFFYCAGMGSILWVVW